jgi:AraC-like DNA-binding protein
MSSAPGMHADPPAADVLEVAAAGRQPFHLNYCGDGPSSANLVCGYLACDARPYNPLIEALPRVIKSGASHNSDNTWLGQFIRIAVVEAAEKRAGSETVLTKLSELMFIEVLRRHIETLPADNAGWLAGLRDPSIGKVMALIHDRPAHDWTLETLAKQSGLSRSVLAERFAEVVGIPPMHYLAKWRMQLASELLTTSNASVAGIAADIGYESEASFSRAFKKMIGVPPSGWRRKRL